MPIERVFVAGAGLMGHGIGQVHAAIGKHVVLYEPDLARAQAGRERIAGNLERSIAKGRIDLDERDAIVGRILATDDLDLVRSADLVVEAVFEDLAVKQKLWSSLDDRAKDGTIFASNTSFCFTARSSKTASTTRSAERTRSRSSVARIRPTIASRSSKSMRPFAIERLRLPAMRSRPAWARARSGSYSTTCLPIAAWTCPMPWPINPAPATNTRSIGMAEE